MFAYLKALAHAKMSQKGALFVEYALILAFVIVVGVVFLNGDNSVASNVNKIFSSTASLLSTAANGSSTSN